MTFNRMGTIPLPLALHLATYTVIGLFCAFAGGLNLIDPTKIIPNAVIFLGLAGFSWGYVFGILMARKEVIRLWGRVRTGARAGAGPAGRGVPAWRLWALPGRGFGKACRCPFPGPGAGGTPPTPRPMTSL